MKMEELHLLVAEDHEFQRRTLVRMLRTLGVTRISEAGDGKAALDIIAAVDPPIDIIISDLEMPGMDGMEFMRHLGQAEHGISVILSSALDEVLISSVEAMTKAYGITLLGAVSKPMTLDQLRGLFEKFAPPRAKPSRQAAPEIPLDEIRRGLAAGEFEPFFQPKVSLADGTVVGMEALARWRHPRMGLVTPNAFIPAMESAGLIDDLTWRILEKSVAQCREWVERGREWTVSVNLSANSLKEPGLAERITALVADYKLDPKYVVLEITESAAITDVGTSLENLTRLCMRHFALSIDDYGTGYSSMQQLARIPFSELKIDRSFVLNAAERESSRVLLSSSLEMGRKLRLKTVAEGVETLVHWNILQNLGCDIAQGYFIAKPMEAQACEDWATRWTPPD
jgi:EAL domain-containing protein (putative c-di-GMP-specific phosphodiesterase class I)